MRTHVSFQKVSNAPQDETPPFGRDVAEALVRSLEQRGLGPIVLDELDYAFTSHCKIGKRTFHVMIGLVDDGVRQWLVSTDSTIGWFGRLFGAKDGQEHVQLVKAIDASLQSAPEVSSIRWYTKNAWNIAPDEDWADSPTT